MNFSVGACFNVLVPPSGGTPPPSDPRHAPRGAVVLGRVRASLLRQSSLARGVVRDEEGAQPTGSTVSPETHTHCRPSRAEHTHTHTADPDLSRRQSVPPVIERLIPASAGRERPVLCVSGLCAVRQVPVINHTLFLELCGGSQTRGPTQ